MRLVVEHPRSNRFRQACYLPSYPNEHLREHKKYMEQQLTKLAEREGFEPSVRLTVHTLSKRAP